MSKALEKPRAAESPYEEAFADERALVASCLVDPSLFPSLRELVAVQDFGDQTCREVWSVMVALDAEGEPWDELSVGDKLRHRGIVDPEVALDRITDGVVPTARERAAERVRNAALQRSAARIIEQADRATRNFADSPVDILRGLQDHAGRLLAGYDGSEEETTESAETTTAQDVLEEVADFVRRFVILSEAQASVVALWTVHTFAASAATTTPYLTVNSAEKRCGKTRLLEVLELLVNRPWLTSRVTAAVLVRKVAAESPTLLLDESDAAFGSGDKEYTDALRGILNAGHRRGGVTSLCVGKGADIKYKDFSVFCPKAISGIGKLPGTVEDRAIPIRLKRKAPGEKVERFRRKLSEPGARRIRARVADWARHHLRQLKNARPELPEVLSDRQQDGAEPLLAIADTIAGQWPARARAALIALFDGTAADESLGVRLLSDIRDIFHAQNADKLTSAELIAELIQIESSPWAEFNHSRSITPITLARLLKPYDIFPRTIRIADVTPKGYMKESFEDAWTRYLRPCSVAPVVSQVPSKSQHPPQSSICAVPEHCPEPPHGPDVAGAKSQEWAVNERIVASVAGQPPNPAQQGHKRRVGGEL